MSQGVGLASCLPKTAWPSDFEGMLNRVEAGIRAYDPCLSCSTHAAGAMPLQVSLVAADGTVLDEVWRS